MPCPNAEYKGRACPAPTINEEIMIPLVRPIFSNEEKQVLNKIIDSRMLASGSYVQDFEKECAKKWHAKHAVAVSSGTTALHAALLACGLKPGDKITVLPSGIESEISAIEVNNKKVDEAFVGQAAIIHVKDNIDISRGDSIVASEKLPQITQDIQATICWMDAKPLQAGAKLVLQHYSNKVKAVVREISEKINLDTLAFEHVTGNISLNEISRITLKTAQPIAFDSYQANRNNGGFILIDENTNNTVAAGVFV